ncbi:MAG TPA: UDP-N-acetylmuramoyl-L-alanine--D-glutamate ligase [Candidatus Dormibacteraeota bacterium]
MKTSLVVGLGRSGVALARFLRDRGDTVRVADSKPAARLGDHLAKLPAGVETVLGGYDDSVLRGCDEVYASPGVPWDAPLLRSARRLGLKVGSEMELFFRYCPAPIIGITGTNGKTTTTALTGAVLARGRRPVLVGGNIGDTVLDRLHEISPEHWVVLELSSFQLESIGRPKPAMGVILNLTPDHLDRHGTFENYVAAKARLIRHLDRGEHAVLNGQDPACRALAAQTAGSVTWFDQESDPPMPVPGAHNLMNAKAAAAVGRLAGIPRSEVDSAIAGFAGVEHRLELVGEWGGVRWYNDSKATNPEAAAVGIESFAGQPVVLIAGGYGGGFELADWVGRIRRLARGVVLIGDSADVLEKELAGHPDVVRARDLDHAIELAAGLAAPGGVVLLSPGYKSYDWFTSFEDRGRRFKDSVRARNQARAG